MEQKKQRGYTFGQLLTTLFIITMTAFFVGSCLSVLVSPGGHPKSRQTACMSNMKQIGLGFFVYAQDYDDTFPPVAQPIKGEPGILYGWAATHTLQGAIFPSIHSASDRARTFLHSPIASFVKNDLVFQCPSAPENSGPLSYMYNDLAAGVSQQAFAAVGQSVLMSEGEDFAGNVGHAYDPASPPAPATYGFNGAVVLGANLQTAPLRHSDGANYLFADGHVKWNKPETVFFPSRFSSQHSHQATKSTPPVGPAPGGGMTFNGKSYIATFHVN